MGRRRTGPPSKKQENLLADVDNADGDLEGGVQDANQVVDFDRFLATLDDSDSSDSDDDDNEGGDDEGVEENEADSDDDDIDDEDMEPEEDEEEDLNEDEEENESGESDENSQEQEQGEEEEEEGEESTPVQNGFGDDEDSGAGSESDDDVDDGKGGQQNLSAKKHKMDLEMLKETDPDFFKFLKENDAELLDFDDSDDEGDSDEDEEALHKPPEALEEASDSEAEEERLDSTSEEHKTKVQKFLRKGLVDINVISHWETQLSSTRDLTIFTNVIEALECAVHTLSEGETSGDMKWRVEGSANFNALLRLCIVHVKGFCVRFLYGNNNVAASESKFDQRPFEVKDKVMPKWQKLRLKIKTYMEIMVQLLKCLGNPDAIGSLLRHCLRMSGFWALMTTKSFKMLKSLVNIWSQGEDSCRVLAFLTIIRMTTYSKDVFLLHMFKQMYIAYVANSKFTSVNTWPSINFMRSSLVELYLLDTSLAYSVAFPFIRQLAIHLRNALSPSASQNEGKQKKSEASRVVYSWQFLHSLHLWVDVLAQAGAKEDENLKLLIYPVVQVCMGTLKLIPTKKFIPLRFHIVKMMTKLQEKAGVFIPVLPLITEVLRLTDFSKKSVSKFSVRPIDLTCCLKSDVSESGYLKAVSENVFETLLSYCKAIGTDLGFPEIVTPTVMYLKSFLKKQCRNPEVHKKFKLLLEKIEANSKYINNKRNSALEAGTVTLADTKSHRILQVSMQASKPHPPILEYATEYFKQNQRVQAKARKPPTETKEEKLIPKPSTKHHSRSDQSNGQDNAFDKPMFESDSGDSDAEFTTKLETKVQKKRKLQDEDQSEAQEVKPKKKKKKVKAVKPKKVFTNQKDDNEAQDELVDFELSD